MLPRHHPDRIRIGFDDRRLVSNAGLMLPATLALHWACLNWYRSTWTWAMPRAGPTPATS